jgi:ferredoxin
VTGAEVSVDADLCIGSAECVRILPAGFQIDEARGVSVPQPAARSADAELLAEAVRSCPTKALRVVDANGDAL